MKHSLSFKNTRLTFRCGLSFQGRSGKARLCGLQAMKPWKSLGLREIPSSSEETTEKVSAPGGPWSAINPVILSSWISRSSLLANR